MTKKPLPPKKTNDAASKEAVDGQQVSIGRIIAILVIGFASCALMFYFIIQLVQALKVDQVDHVGIEQGASMM